ncbi:RNA polymerase sigma factor [Aurantivibrio infirmus]
MNSVDLDGFLASVEQRAFRMANFAVKNPDDALEIVQDAMLRLSQRYADKDCSDWAPLFYRILHNRINDHHRSSKTRNRWLYWFEQFSSSDSDKDSDHNLDLVDEDSLDGEQQLLVDQSMESLNEAISELPRRQREAFFLRCWEGLSTRQTALAMGCSEGSVKTHYSRAINFLKTALTDRGHG